MKKLIVLIPHYNSVFDLIESIKSIRENIRVDILIIDDGSDIAVPEKLKLQEVYKHGEIFLDFLGENLGIEHALNRGLYLISKMNYDYIGRLDCGDFCVKDRFYKQVSYLDNNKDVYLLGTWANIIDMNKRVLYILKHPTSYRDIKNKMFINSMFVHPSVVFKTTLINEVGYYPVKYKAAEDYAYFFNIVNRFKAENLAEPLLDYVVNNKSISSQKRKLQVKSRIRVIIDNFEIGFFPLYGLLKNGMLFFISRETSNKIKRLLRS